MDNREKLGYKLQQVQRYLKRPDGEFLKFGGFRYRSCTDILHCMQPALEKYGLSVQFKTEYKPIEGIFQAEHMAIITDRETGEKNTISCTEIVSTIKTAQDVPTDRVEKFCCGLKMALIGVLGGDVELEEGEFLELQNSEAAFFDNEQQKNITQIQCQLLQKTAKRKGIALESILAYYAVNSITQLSEKNYIDAMAKLQEKR